MEPAVISRICCWSAPAYFSLTLCFGKNALVCRQAAAAAGNLSLLFSFWLNWLHKDIEKKKKIVLFHCLTLFNRCVFCTRAVKVQQTQCAKQGENNIVAMLT